MSILRHIIYFYLLKCTNLYSRTHNFYVIRQKIRDCQHSHNRGFSHYHNRHPYSVQVQTLTRCSNQNWSTEPIIDMQCTKNHPIYKYIRWLILYIIYDQLVFCSATDYSSSAASSAAGSRAFMLRLIFFSSPLKSTTFAVIT